MRYKVNIRIDTTVYRTKTFEADTPDKAKELAEDDCWIASKGWKLTSMTDVSAEVVQVSEIKQ